MKVLIVLVLLLLVAAVWDYGKGKIPNGIILTGCIYGILKLLSEGNVLMYIPGFCFPLLILFPLYKIGVLGAGDIKLFSMLGLYFPFMEVIVCMFTAFILGAVISVISFIRYDNFLERITYLFSYLRECLSQKHFRYYYLDSKGKIISESENDHSKIHFAIPIFFSVLFHVGGIF